MAGRLPTHAAPGVATLEHTPDRGGARTSGLVRTSDQVTATVSAADADGLSLSHPVTSSRTATEGDATTRIEHLLRSTSNPYLPRTTAGTEGLLMHSRGTGWSTSGLVEATLGWRLFSTLIRRGQGSRGASAETSLSMVRGLSVGMLP